MSKKGNKRITVRAATRHDYDILVTHRSKMWHDIHKEYSYEELEKSDADYRRWLVEMRRKKKFFGFVALAGDRIVGSGCVWLRSNQPRPLGAASSAKKNFFETPYLLSMYTEHEFRGVGVASKIVREAMKECKRRGYKVMTLHASKFGRRVYKNLGWKRTWEMRFDI